MTIGADDTKNKGISSSSVDDVLSPALHLHSSDSPDNMLVGEILTASNYGEWSLDMKDALIAKDKYGYVDGTILKPTDPRALTAWTRCDAMVKGWLKTSMDKEIRSSIRFAEHASEIWADLRARFGQGSASRAYELHRLINLLQQEKNIVSAFYTSLRSNWE
ncbi:unnamed protein product [Linum trigynum]|uniref:Retrotransposon Copia-like N-terminal domain-containing protein n=1 Tax=Linum trigynum TaxID=586398 RepID=A0AAV2GTG4_9ROSI